MFEISILIFVTWIFYDICASNMTGNILGGDYTEINKYPHSVYIHITCNETYICGGSILNQDIALTAAHCFEDCDTGASIHLKYGHSAIQNMRSRLANGWIVHEKYNPVTMANDIGLVAARLPLQLASFSKRVAIMKDPPHVDWGYVAGWGVINDQAETAQALKFAKQQLQSPKICRRIGKLPVGSFCAGPIHGAGSPDRGDSGSALIINKYVQIGIVSYKTADYSLVVYTNVSYFYNWIKRAALKLFCRKSSVRKIN